MNELQKTIIEVLNELEPYEEFELETELVESGILDSLAIVFVITRLEEKLGIMIGEKEVTPENFKNVLMIEKLLSR